MYIFLSLTFFNRCRLLCLVLWMFCLWWGLVPGNYACRHVGTMVVWLRWCRGNELEMVASISAAPPPPSPTHTHKQQPSRTQHRSLQPCDKMSRPILRWNSWTAFLVQVSGQILESSQTWVFVRFSTPVFLFYKMLFINSLVLLLFCGFFCMGFKNQSRVWFSVKSASRRDCE
jgi:hypothetical protein